MITKPGGNYTQPHYSPITEETTYEVYVGWLLIDSFDNDVDATDCLRQAMKERDMSHGA